MSFKFGEGSSNAASMFTKKFESADEIEEKRRQRQEEWEKVRKPDQPKVAPEEEYDPRSLYDKLQDQKLKAQEEYDQKHRLSNQVKGLEDDEAAFLDFVSNRQMEIDNQRRKEEADALEEYRQAVLDKAKTGAKPADSKPNKPTASAQKSSKKSQLDLLKGAVKRKRSDNSQDEEKKPKVSANECSASDRGDVSNTKQPAATATTSVPDTLTSQTQNTTAAPPTMLVGGVLPGLGHYDSATTSDSDSSSSDSDADDAQMRGSCQSKVMSKIRQMLKG